MADEQPQKNDNPSAGGGSKSNNRRYFRRRRKGPASGGEGQAAPSQEKQPSRSQAEPKAQGSRVPEQRNEQQEKRHKRRRSGNSSTNRRSSSSRRQRRDEQSASVLPPVAPEAERSPEPVDVYVHTHIVRPAYRDAGGDYVSETSFLAGRRPPEASIHMERLQEEIRSHLDEWFNRPVVPVKVIREAGDENWDEEEE